VSSQLVSKRGNRDQFGAMVAACQSAGVGVLVDVILNHMTAGSGTGIGGTGASVSESVD
jgi:alpha-amylase